MKPGRIKIKISKSLQQKILKGTPWVHFYEIQNEIGPARPGDLGVIYDHKNQFLAVGLYDPFSDIRLRILETRNSVDINREFFELRLQKAAALRAVLDKRATTGYRMVNGENDGFPGLVIDRYADTLVFKVYSVAWEPYLPDVVSILEETAGAERAVLLLSRHVDRTEKGGLRQGQVLFGSAPEGPVVFKENNLIFEADVLEGQKTGFYFDQRENRERLRDLSKGASVLNVFSYTGGFSVYCMQGGCRSVVEVDVNPKALETARQNMAFNFPDAVVQPGKWEQVEGDAFQVLNRFKKEGRTFDLVILDPPAFAGNRKHKPQAKQAYLRLAKAGAECTRPDGLLFAASCSQPVKADEFYRAVDLGIRQTRRKGKTVFKSGHAVDHPVSFRDGAYLKGICYNIK